MCVCVLASLVFYIPSIFKITYQTELGQTLDLLTAPEDHVDFTTYTMERYYGY